MTPQSVPSRRGDPGSSIRHVPWAKRLQHLDWLTRNERAFRCSAPAVWNSLPQTVLSSDSDAVFKLRHSSLRLSLLSLLTNTLPGPSASEVMTLGRYTNLFIIIIISAGLVGMTNRQSRRQNRLQH